MAKKKGLNAGEIGEPYVLLRLIGSGRVALADENEEPVEGYYLDVMEALRREKKERWVRYIRAEDMGDYYTVVITVNGEIASLSRTDVFIARADEIRDRLLVSGKSRLSDDQKRFFDEIEVTTSKTYSEEGEKSDIYLCVGDPRSGTVRPDLGYSIKSKWKDPGTLFNCAPNGARSIYRLSGDIDDQLITRVNSLLDNKHHADVIGRWRMLAEHGIEFEFVDYAYAPQARCRAFRLTLDLISPYAIPMFEQIVRQHFENGLFPTGCPMSEVNDWLIENNPSNVARPEVQYEYMLKTFLYAAHCSLTASKPWDGRSRVNGGLITVDKQGEIIAFNALDGDAFKSYLFNHTCMDYPSTHPKHGKYGVVYWNEALNSYCFDLNFQIRYNRL